ncbi:transposase (plasmid) [Frondihabitans sp. PAMC 28766]|uniref:IS110 family transposase n=1 Tax=Frondihabitans sp. PAMC 28766 TaxID=1795630 RepID=UPI00078C192C|nr:IS110 family transposase [Frondihabitans sp. PAMC 28766]AMM22554.1 transposase [Frondihabitans sp. PAMC 28766]AMM22740.1 transposase [Frondihabitans sp. PAMC 28766]
MTIVADEFTHVIGVDTHARTHTYAAVEARTGEILGTAVFPTSPAGLARARSWINRRAPESMLVAIEGTGSYGATLTRALQAEGIEVREVKPPRRATRSAHGKSDEIDAIAAARTAIASPLSELSTPRAEGIRSALRVLLVARQALDSRRTADNNMLTALLRSFSLGVDARRPLTVSQVQTVGGWRERCTDDSVIGTIRSEAKRLATSILAATRQLDQNHAALAHHVQELAPGFLNIKGVGPVTGAIILAAYSHRGRIRSEAAFASLAGVAPLQASSGNVVRHRLSRRGDRQLNRAMDIIARTRMVSDAGTRAYVDRRTAEGKSRREIRRCLKRYVARQIFRQLNSLMG